MYLFKYFIININLIKFSISINLIKISLSYTSLCELLATTESMTYYHESININLWFKLLAIMK